MLTRTGGPSLAGAGVCQPVEVGLPERERLDDKLLPFFFFAFPHFLLFVEQERR